MRPKSGCFRIATVLPCILLAACGGDRDRDVGLAPVPLVEAVQTRVGALPIEETLPGVVRARNQVTIRPEIDGRVVEVLVRSGEAVRAGQVLVRLDETEARERLRQAEADVRFAEASAVATRARVAELAARVARQRALAEQELVSAQDLESLEAQLDALRAGADEDVARVEQARATAEERRSALGKTEVRAPVSGRLGERRVEVGMRVDPSAVLFQVGDLDELIVELNLTEAMLARVATGQPALLSSRGDSGEPVRAELSRISPFLAEQSFTAAGEIDVDNRGGRLRPGMFVDVRILVGESRRATLVPVGALWDDPRSGRRGVFVVEEVSGLDEAPRDTTDSPETPRAVAFRRVEILAQGRGAAGVTGIDEGDWVVTVGQQLLGSELRAGRQAAAEGQDPAGDGAVSARVRPVSWQRVQALQDLQSEDLLEGFLEKQRRVAEALGAEIPESEDEVDRVMEEASAEASDGAPPPEGV